MKNKLKRFQNKKLAILGLGIENLAFLEFLSSQKIDNSITIFDSRTKEELSDRLAKLEDQNNLIFKKTGSLKDFDIILRSPGFPLFNEEIKKARKARVEISSPMKLFFELCPTKNIIGITGTKGKGTTSSLIFEIIKLSGKKAYFGGNIGLAPFSFINKLRTTDYVVLELSSFQLEDKTVSPKISVITNFTEEHLAPADPNNPNYHKSMDSYWKAKANILIHQDKTDYLVINTKLKQKISKLNLKSNIVYFEKSQLPSSIPGEHNKENIAAAVEVSRILRIKKDIVNKAVKNFGGLEYRIEFIKKLKDVSYYNDSFATTPEAAITALKAFSSPIILIAGGADKGSSFKHFARQIKRSAKFVVLFEGVASPKIKKELLAKSYPAVQIKTVSSMQEAIDIANAQTEAGDIILMSTACASFGIFKNYKERGSQFTDCVNNLK